MTRAISSLEDPDEALSGSGVLSSLLSLFSVLHGVRDRLQPSRRRTPRLVLGRACRFQFGSTVLAGTTRDISFVGVSAVGVSAVFPDAHEVHFTAGVLSIEEVELSDQLFSGTLFLGVDTPLSPLYLGYGRAEGGSEEFYVFIGRAF